MGQCQVTWRGASVGDHDVERGLNATEGMVTFEEGQVRGYINIHVTADDDPEAKEKYKIVLSDVTTFGMASTLRPRCNKDFSRLYF